MENKIGGFEMVKFYLRWRANPKFCPESDEEREKMRLPMLKAVEADMHAGVLKDWGRCVDGSGGYSIWEVPSEDALFAGLRKYKPYLDFDVREVVNLEQAIEYSIKALERFKKAASQPSKQFP